MCSSDLMLRHFYKEDIGEKDLTSEALFDEKERGSGTFIAKENGIFVGAQIVQEAMRLLDPDVHVTLFKKDGDRLEKGGSHCKSRRENAGVAWCRKSDPEFDSAYEWDCHADCFCRFGA